MSLLSSPGSKDTPDRPTPSRTPFRRRGRWPVLFIACVLIVIVAIIGQIFYQQQTGMIVGRPLASSQTHLHAVVISSQPGIIYLGTHFGLFTSTNDGSTWPQRQGALNTTMVTSIAVSPTNPAFLAVLAIPTNGGGQQAGVYMSADAGKAWHFTLPTGLPATAYPYAIQAASGTNGHFYTFFSSAGWFETRDLGQHWSAITAGSLATLQSPSLLTNDRNPEQLLMGGDQGLFESENDGQSWRQTTALGGSVLALTGTQPTGNDTTRTVLCATDQGLYRGLEQHSQIVWHAVHMPAVASPTRLVMNADGSILYALFGSDLWFSGDQGTTWVHRWHFARSDMVALVLNPHNPQEVVAGFFWPGLVLRSTNQGISWQTLTH